LKLHEVEFKLHFVDACRFAMPQLLINIVSLFKGYELTITLIRPLECRILW
jgi:hypothetical protein